MDDHDHFTLGVNSNIDLTENNINPSLRNLGLSNVSDHEFMPLSGNNFSIHHHQRDDYGLPFVPLPHDDIIKRTSPDEFFGNSNPPNFISGVTRGNKANRNTGHGGKRRKKNSEARVEKPKEVVHVRAKRGEATDSHSLAERSRREKINAKLRCLQDLVPGCYKYQQTMGMSVMLDVTINYIQSLQNQIEFLSMKLSAASIFYDFNSAEMEALDNMRGANGYEGQVMERMGGEGYGDLLQFPSTWPL